MPTFDELLEQRRQMAAQQPAQLSQGRQLAAGIGSLFGRNTSAQAPLQNIQAAQQSFQAPQKQKEEALDTQIQVAGVQEKRKKDVDEDDPASDVSKRAQDFTLGAFKINDPNDTQVIRGLSAKRIKDLGVFDVLTNFAKLRAEKNDRSISAQRLELDKKRQGEIDAERDDRFIERAVQAFEKDKVATKSREQIANSSTALSMLDANNPIADEAVKTFLARASGEVGVLTDRDVARFGGSKALISRIQQSAQQLQSGKLTPENRSFLKDLATQMSQRANANLEERGKKLAREYSKIRKNAITEDQLLDIYGLGQQPQAAPPSQPQPQPKAGGLAPDKARRLQELRRKAGRQ